MSGDRESCPGPSIKCMACKKTIRKNQSRIQCEDCLNICHLKCFDQEGKEAVEHLCPQCLNANYDLGPFEQDLSDTLHELTEIRELVSQRGLNILHQNIRGLVSHKHNILEILANFPKIHIFALSETHLSTIDDAVLQITGYAFIGKCCKSAQGVGWRGWCVYFYRLYRFKAC